MTTKRLYWTIAFIIIGVIAFQVYLYIDEKKPVTVSVTNYLEGITEIDLFGSITIPTDAELANYTDAEATELYIELFKATATVHKTKKKYIEQREALREALWDIVTDISRQAEVNQLIQQSKKFDRILYDLFEQQGQLFQETTRVANHKRSLR